MGEKLGQVGLNQFEDVRMSLQEIFGEPHVELRVFPRGTPSLTFATGSQNQSFSYPTMA